MGWVTSPKTLSFLPSTKYSVSRALEFEIPIISSFLSNGCCGEGFCRWCKISVDILRIVRGAINSDTKLVPSKQPHHNRSEAILTASVWHCKCLLTLYILSLTLAECEDWLSSQKSSPLSLLIAWICTNSEPRDMADTPNIQWIKIIYFHTSRPARALHWRHSAPTLVISLKVCLRNLHLQWRYYSEEFTSSVTSSKRAYILRLWWRR